MPEEDADDADEGGETEPEPDSTSATAIADGIPVGSDADDGSERGRRHLPPHWKVRK